MVTQIMILVVVGKWIISAKKNSICDCSRANRITQTDEITEIAVPISKLPSNIVL